jgi:hypothetical protein
MAQFLRQSTAATIMFGPFVDKTDGVTLKTDATTITDIDHASTGIFLSKAGAAAAIRHASVTASVADAYGMMKVTLDPTDTNTIGTLDVLFAKAATYLPVHKQFTVLDEAVYDALFGTVALATATNITGGTITTVTNLTNAPTNGDLTSTMKTSVQTAADAALVAENLDHLLKVAAVAGDAVDSSIVARLASKSATPSFASFVNTTDSLEAIRDKETDIETDTAEIGTAGAGLTALATQASVDDLPTNAELATALGTADDAVLAAIAGLNDLSAAEVNTEVDAALADYDGPTHTELTNELATADDAVLAQVALVKAKTDLLVSTVAGTVDANVQRINDVAITGDGSAGDKFDVV